MATTTKTAKAGNVRRRRYSTSEPKAESARYDEARKQVVVQLSNGYAVAIPLAKLAEVAHASPTDLATVEVIGAGNILHWESLDADYSVLALVVDAIGAKQAAREFGRLGGRTRSKLKAASSRANGKRGGRPRKLAPGRRAE